jgi:hypothetical protein
MVEPTEESTVPRVGLPRYLTRQLPSWPLEPTVSLPLDVAMLTPPAQAKHRLLHPLQRRYDPPAGTAEAQPDEPLAALAEHRTIVVRHP